MKQGNALSRTAASVTHEELSALMPLLANCKAEINATTLSRIEAELRGNAQLLGLVEQARSDKRLAARVRGIVREKFARFFEESALLAHAINKPYGYPGDCWILEALYDLQPVSQTEAGRTIDRWCMQSALPQAVVERKNIIRDILQKRMAEAMELKILSIACGSAREIREIPAEMLAHHHITLLDNDPRVFDYFGKKGGAGCEFVSSNALEFNLNERFDIVYSFGLFDYLPDRLLDAAIRCALLHLAPKGTFIFALKDVRYYTPALYDWFCDWRFVSRTEADLDKLCHRHGLVLKELKKTENKAVVVAVCEIDGLLA